MSRKSGLIFTTLLVFLTVSCAFGADGNNEIANDYITNLQNEISKDITRLRQSIEIELADIKLESPDVANRLQELAALASTASEDVTAWGYSDEVREQYMRLLSDISIAYSAYGALLRRNDPVSDSTRNSETSSEELSSIETITSPDINISDAMRLEITRTSRQIEVQAFYLQSRMSKLKLDIAKAASLRKELEDAKSGEKSLADTRTHLLELESARISVALTRIQIIEMRKLFERNVSELQRLRNRLANIQGSMTFSQELLNENLDKLKKRIDELTLDMSNARKSLDSANSSLVKARVALGSADVTPLTIASSTYLARSARVSYWEYMLSLLEEEISLNKELLDFWQVRYKLFHDELSGEEIWKIRDEAQAKVLGLQRRLEGIRALENATLKQIDNLKAQTETEEVSGIIQQNLIQAQDNHRRIISDVFNKYEALIPNSIFYQQRLYIEANENLSALRLAEKVRSFSYDTIMGFLDTQLWEGEGYSVTVSKLVIAIAVFLSSFFLSSWGSNLLKRRILKRAKASITAASAIQRIVFYVLWIAFVLIALNIVKIPLTAFAFMGGAMAVGIGFGMQNIFNNLISGFIVIFSRPFKVNDIVDVAGTQGTVIDIGSRSTKIKTWDGFDVVLPNRYFLENSVTNWTGTDTRKREVLKIGVSYDSDSRKVEELLLGVVKGHSKILKDPAPFVIFKDFADSSLNFEVYYWFDLKQASGMKISSDMRHHISALFKKEGIEIPFPQRVVHVVNDNDDNSGENLR